MLCAGCTGNGGAAYSDGSVYNPDGTPVSSNSAGGGTGGGSSGAGAGSSASGGFTASDLWNRANAGDATGIVQLVSSDTQASPETCTIAFSASDLGLPSGGTARLVIEEIAYDVTASADADGNVTFEVPLIQVGATVTVELFVMDTDDTVLWYGSKTQQVGNGDNLEITLESQVSGPTVIMKTGPNIKTALVALGAKTDPVKTFAASSIPPADGVTTEKLSADDSPTEVLAWCDGTSIKYYAAGYTDTGTKIPLNADSSKMFYYCDKLSSIDLSGFDTSNVTNMDYMFYQCSGLSSLNLSGFDTGKVTNMQSMFYSCGLTSLDVSGFDTGNVITMDNMFRYCGGLTSLDVSGWNTGKVENMKCMFAGCSGLTSLDVSGFDTSSATNMDSLFGSCSGLSSLDVSGFNTGSVTNMATMFYNCSSLGSLDLSNWNTSNVTNMKQMFQNCSSLGTIYGSAGFDTTNVTGSNSTGMFSGCTSLQGGAGTTFDPGVTDKTYARIDGDGGPGYFTAH